MTQSILVVDDEKNLRLMVQTVLAKNGFHAVAVEDADAALAELQKTRFDLLLVDYMMPKTDGINLILQIRQSSDPPPSILMTAFGSVDTVISAMRAGATDYIPKPFSPDELLHVISRNIRTQSLQREVTELRAEVRSARQIKELGIVAESPSMKELLATAKQAAASSAAILIQGETGTGKELVAQFIHAQSLRAEKPFIAVNCGALHPGLLLSELYGHKRGAFTGAVEDRIGKFQAANGGTLFLDEVGELDQAAQVKLLRVLQEGEIERVGDPRTIKVDVRVIAATNRRLEDMVAEETFRADLYYRLAVIPLYIAPLRDRPQDIFPLSKMFANEFAADSKKPTPELSPDAKRTLVEYSWPGNIRELRNIVQRAVVLAPPGNSELEIKQLVASQSGKSSSGGIFEQALAEQWPFERLESEYLKALLQRKELSQADVAQILQMDTSTLWRKRKKYGL